MVLAMFVFPEQSLKDSVCVDEVPSRGENGWNHCSALPAEVGTRLLHISFQHSFKCNPCGVCSALPTVWVAPIAEVSFFQRSSRLECLRSRHWLGAPFLVMTVLRSVDGALSLIVFVRLFLGFHSRRAALLPDQRPALCLHFNFFTSSLRMEPCWLGWDSHVWVSYCTEIIPYGVSIVPSPPPSLHFITNVPGNLQSPVPSHSFYVFKHFLSFERFLRAYCIYIASIPYASPLTVLTVSRLPPDFMTSSSLIIATCKHVSTHMHTYTHKYLNITCWVWLICACV